MTGRSIRRELFLWLAAALVVALAVASVATYLRAREEANQIFDYQLRQMAASLTGVPLAGSPGGLVVGDDALVVQVWDRNGVQLFLSQPQQPLPQYAKLGFNTVKTAAGDWRVFSTLTDDQVVQVVQEDVVASPLLAAFAIREGPHAGNKHAPDLIFAGASYYERLALDAGKAVVVRVFVADRDDVGLLVERTQPEAPVVRVCNDGGVLALQPEASMPKPCDFCQLSTFAFVGERRPN
jgi:hypothetical protein